MSPARPKKSIPLVTATSSTLRRKVDPDPMNTATGEMLSTALGFLSGWLPTYPLGYRNWPAQASVTISIDRSKLIEDDPDCPGEAVAVTQWDMVTSLLAAGGEISNLGYQLNRDNEAPHVQFTVGLGLVEDDYRREYALSLTIHPAMDLRPIYERAENDNDEIYGEIMNWICEALERQTGSHETWEKLLDKLTEPDPINA